MQMCPYINVHLGLGLKTRVLGHGLGLKGLDVGLGLASSFESLLTSLPITGELAPAERWTTVNYIMTG